MQGARGHLRRAAFRPRLLHRHRAAAPQSQPVISAAMLVPLQPAGCGVASDVEATVMEPGAPRFKSAVMGRTVLGASRER